MRALHSYILILLVFILTWTSCDVIEEPYLRDGVTPPPDTSACPVPVFPDPGPALQYVLLEDYTGHKCPNCPEAAKLAHDLQAQWGNRLIVLTIHAGWFATFGSAPYTTDYTTPAGDAWDQTFGISNFGNPNGMVNRTGYAQTHIVGPANWAGRIQDEMQQTPKLSMQLITDYTDSERKLCAHVRTTWLSDMQEALNLVVVMTEDSLVSPQKNNNPQIGPVPDILEYTHMHVLRHALTSSWGNSIASPDSLLVAGTRKIHTFRYDLPEANMPKQCHIVAFVYQTSNYRILQVVEAPVVQP